MIDADGGEKTGEERVFQACSDAKRGLQMQDVVSFELAHIRNHITDVAHKLVR